MKTTIELPDHLAERAKRHAASSRRTTLRHLVIAGLERELDRRESSDTVDFQWVTVKGAGLQIEIEHVIPTSYGLPT